MMPLRNHITLDPLLYGRVYNITAIGVYFPGIPQLNKYSDICYEKLNNLSYSIISVNTDAAISLS